MPAHGNNIESKLKESAKYADKRSQGLLREILKRYRSWRTANENLKGPGREPTVADEDIVHRRAQIYDEYKLFLDQARYAEHFDSRSNLISTALEEFMEFLFRDLVAAFRGAPLIGKAHTFKDIFFLPQSYSAMVKSPSAKVEVKDHDFVIGARVLATLRCSESKASGSQELTWDLPAVAVECKTYLDKTMLESSSTAAEQLKARNPNALYLVVMEYIKLTERVNLQKYKLDQIYVLRCQKNVDREYRCNLDMETRVDARSGWRQKQISGPVVWDLFRTVREHLTADWGAEDLEARIERGYLLGHGQDTFPSSAPEEVAEEPASYEPQLQLDVQ